MVTADSLLVKAGSGVLTLGNPDSAGVPSSFAKQTIVLPLYNDLDSVKETFSNHWHEIAAIIVEPFPANCGLILPKPGYLQDFEICAHCISLFLFSMR